MSVSAYPLQWPEGWPRARSRKDGQFATKGRANEHGWRPTLGITMDVAMRRLTTELERLGVDIRDDSIVSTNLKLGMSGRPRGDQGEPGDPGVAVYFRKNNGPMRVIAIDAYTRVRDNIAAIAATLEAMRAIERHGGAQILERAFTGFTALPKPGGADWWEVLQLPRTATRAELDEKFRELARARHPDLGGSQHAMAELNRARQQALQELKA